MRKNIPIYKQADTAEPRLIIFSGAGLSADSGLATYRGSEDSIWARTNLDRVCNIVTWKNHFTDVHNFYNTYRAEVGTKTPNDLHILVKRLQSKHDTVILTQNIDDLLEKAGCTDVIHLHGIITSMACLACGNEWSIGYSPWTPMVDMCIKCSSKKGVKPAVVFFNESAPLYRYMYKALSTIRPQDILVVIGTRGEVIPIHQMAMKLDCRKVLVTIIDPTDMNDYSGYDHIIYGNADTSSLELEKFISSTII